MIRVDFYLLPDLHLNARHHYACRIIEKAYQQNRRVYVYTSDQQQAHTMDDLLWTYRDDSFLPHNLYGELLNPPPPIQIGYVDAPPAHRDILINLRSELPAFYAQFKRVIEIIPQDEPSRTRARQHYKTYREQGCELQSHHIT